VQVGAPQYIDPYSIIFFLKIFPYRPLCNDLHRPAPLSKKPVKSRLSGIPLVQVDAGRFALVQVNAGAFHYPSSVKTDIYLRWVWN
jgi:hypothetical protein